MSPIIARSPGIARACRDHGADLAFTYQGDALKKRVQPLAEEVDGLAVCHCDVTEPASIDAVFSAVKSAGASLDSPAHAIAFSDRAQLDGRYIDTTEDNFIKTMVISRYSFTALAQRAELMTNGGSNVDDELIMAAESGCPTTMSWACQGGAESWRDIRPPTWESKKSG